MSGSEARQAQGGRAAVGSRIAVVLPCLNEAEVIGEVIAAFRSALPGASIHVIDNASTDGTAQAAEAAGADVLLEPMRGKGHAVRRAFAAVEADVYVICDGDGTYDAGRAGELVRLLSEQRLDMVTAVRRKSGELAYRPGHEVGNRLFNTLLRVAFGSQFRDILSGYRALSRRFVRSFPAMSDGFEIETEMSVHAILLRMPAREVECDYVGRPTGSASKLRTWRDGLRILATMAALVRQHRPLSFFSIFAAMLFGVALALFMPVFIAYLQTGLVPRLPTLVVSAALGVSALLALACGLILDSTSRMQLEMRRLLYLNTVPRAEPQAPAGERFPP